MALLTSSVQAISIQAQSQAHAQFNFKDLVADKINQVAGGDLEEKLQSKVDEAQSKIDEATNGQVNMEELLKKAKEGQGLN